jgi:putative ABC transport system permease protein
MIRQLLHLAPAPDDLKQAIRLLARAPGLSAIIIVTLTLAIGANTAIFSIANGLILRPLPVHDPDRLALLTEDAPNPQTTWTYPIWKAIDARANMFDGAFAWSTFDTGFNISERGQAQFVQGMWASANMFSVLGLTPALGRTFAPSDDQNGGGPGGPVAIISYAYWQTRFGGATDVVGKRLVIERVPFTIVGVAPRGFRGLVVGRSFDVAIPFGVEPLFRGAKESWLDKRSTWWLSIAVRVKPGQTLAQASQRLRAVQPQIREATQPSEVTNPPERFLSAPLTFSPAATGRSGLREQYQRPLVVLSIAVAVILLIACANIANLLLVRAVRRHHEWSVRVALGGSRWRLARQLLIESLLLAGTGAGFGLLVARWTAQLLVTRLANESVAVDLTLDWRVLAFVTTAAVLTAVAFGVAPALRAARTDPIDVLKPHTRASSSRRDASIASSLVVAQLALSVALVFAAGLFVRTLMSVKSVPLGLDRDRVMLLDLNTMRSGVPDTGRLTTYETIRRRALTVAGIDAAAVSMIAPVSGRLWTQRIEVSGRPTSGDDPSGPEGIGYTSAPLPRNSSLSAFNAITPGWLATYSTRLIAGRDITDRDTATGARVALVNQAFARKFLNGDPIGQTIHAKRAEAAPPREIVGIVADAVYRDVREPVLPTVYVPLAQYDPTAREVAPSEVTLAVRLSPAMQRTAVKALVDAIGNVAPNVPLVVHTLASQIDDTLVQENLLAELGALFGFVALVLSALGLYGVTSYTVSLQRTDMAVRMALGATPLRLIAFVMHRVSLIGCAGIVLGVALSLAASRALTSLLYGVAPRDTRTLVFSALILGGVAAAAGLIPAIKAGRANIARLMA